MLRSLMVRNFVLVDHLELQLQSGFGALTGETGAGKSLLIDALLCLLGGRVGAGAIMKGQTRAEISAGFSLTPQVMEWLTANDFVPEDDHCLVRRVLEEGRTRGYICGTSATTAQLRELGEMLMDIQGQHDHHQLLRATSQRDLLDQWANAVDVARAVRENHRHWQEAQELRLSAERNAAAAMQEKELLQWQAQELAGLGFTLENWLQLQQDHKRLANRQQLAEALTTACSALEQDAIHRSVEALRPVADVDPAIKEAMTLLQEAHIQVSESLRTLTHCQQRLDESADLNLAVLDERLGAVHNIARKHKVAPELLPQVLQQLTSRLQILQESADPALLLAKEQEWQSAYQQSARKLSTLRKAAARDMSARVSEIMAELAMQGGRMKVDLSPLEQGTASGLEKVEFLISPHAGQELAPLARTASGGELSRIGLAVSMATHDATVRRPTLIFDEVDAGIGGAVADVVGRMLARLGQTSQVLCVTHLAQVAARADWQCAVVKDRAITHVQNLDAQQRVEEIARMVGGASITDTTRQHAREMLGTRIGKSVVRR